MTISFFHKYFIRKLFTKVLTLSSRRIPRAGPLEGKDTPDDTFQANMQNSMGPSLVSIQQPTQTPGCSQT